MRFPRRPLKHLSAISVSNVDKKSVEGERPVRLVNYTDVYYGDRITPGMQLMQATATQQQFAAFRLSDGDVLITKDSETADDIGVAAYVDSASSDMVLGYHLALLRPRRPMAEGRFLYWVMESIVAREQLSVGATGVTRYGLRVDAIGSVLAPAPPLPVQRAIAEFLDTETARIDSLIAKKQRMIELTKERRRSVIDNHVVPALLGGSADEGSEPWSVTSLKRTADFFTDGDWIESPYIVDSGIRLIQTGNVGEGVYREQGFRFITEETFAELRCTELYPRDVLISRLAGPVGCACLAPDLGGRMIASVDVVIMRPSAALDPEFAVYWLSSSAHLDLAELLARGTTMQRLSRSQVGDMPIPLPPIEVQRERSAVIREQLHALEGLSHRLSRQIELLREHRQALITAAVTGELEVAA